VTDSEDVVRRRLHRIGEGVLPIGGSATVDRVIDRYHRQRRARMVWLGITVATLLALSVPVALGATGAAPKTTGGAIAADRSAAASGGATVPSTTAGPTAPAGPGFTPRSGPAQAEIGVTYPFDLYTHCGIRTARFAGRDWAAVHPAADPQRLPNSAGIAAYTGYVAGTMILVRPDLLRFTITDRYAAGTGQAFDFAPASGPAPLCA
jgi:hypothetical protein